MSDDRRDVGDRFDRKARKQRRLPPDRTGRSRVNEALRRLEAAAGADMADLCLDEHWDEEDGAQGWT